MNFLGILHKHLSLFAHEPELQARLLDACTVCLFPSDRYLQGLCLGHFMEQNVPVSTAVHANSSNSSTVPVRHLERWKLFQYAVVTAAFEVVFEVLDTGLVQVKNWEDLICIPAIAVLALIQFGLGVQESYEAVSVKRKSSVSAPPDANDVDPSAILIQKVEIIPSLITEAAYEAVVEALHSLPDRIWNWEDFVKASKSLLQCMRAFVLPVRKNYKTWLMARNIPPSTLLDAHASELHEAFASNIVEALDSLSDEIPHRQDMINVFESLRQSFNLIHSRAPNNFHVWAVVFQAKCFFLRLCEVFCHPSQFAIIFLDFFSLVHSRRNGRQPGPDVILPMSSPMKRPSSRLSRLLLHHSRDLPQHEFEVDIPLSGSSHPWTVAVIDLNGVPLEIAERRYSSGADIYGLASMLFLVEILDLLLAPSWIFFFYVLPKIPATWMFISVFGDGTLTLLPQSEGHHTSTRGYALLLDEEFSVVLKGAQNVMEAITLRGFHFSYLSADLLQIPVWKVAVNLILEGWFEGLLYLMAILPVWRFIRLSFTSLWSQVIGTLVLLTFFPPITSCPQFLRAATRTDSDFLKGLVQSLAVFAAEFVRSMARLAPIMVSWFLYIHDYTVFSELQLIVDLIPPLGLAFILSVPSQNYPVRTAKFLDILGKPPVKRWRFRTPAAAATFQCLVICHGIRRPVKEIDVKGVLDSLIPDQRAVWATWKARIADRIAHEVEISFAPTLPTFRDAKLQNQLKAYLDEAQYAYDAYSRWLTDKRAALVSAAVTSRNQATEQPSNPSSR